MMFNLGTRELKNNTAKLKFERNFKKVSPKKLQGKEKKKKHFLFSKKNYM